MMICEACGIGRFHQVNTPYLCWLEEQIVVVPDAPAMICDVCGEAIYDEDFVQALQLLLDEGRPRTEREPTAHGRSLVTGSWVWHRLRRSM